MACCQCFTFKRSRSKRAVVAAEEPHYPEVLLNESEVGKNLVRRFQWEEIERVTKNFSTVIGEGGFSTVYLGAFLGKSSIQGAVKIHRNSERLHRAFKQELEVLMHICHDNIVKLLGYCDDREEGVLVFELVSNGTLHDKLHGHGASSMPPHLSWTERMSIAFQLAQALHHLHENCKHQIVHCDVTSSNVLLDQELNCKLCDFGFAKMGFSSTILPCSAKTVMGSPGYVDSHYLRTGIISKKNDVYSFGVLVLELISGMKAFCGERQQLLTTIMAGALKEPRRVVEMVDDRLKGAFDTEEAVAMASISAACTREQPGMRPSMAEVLKTMEKKISSLFPLSN